ncbi:hypothetical protein K4L44_14600 [Halosquirtibacter laminarini]|uniref:Uncharacterized protein n=1 Tax=Halosquirtibacter laminarini TaxID=3374600 RepID=A0AC61NN10_9BACT|nr:hypothetical protein K4L44_14600 [Prolixibacteraceae bacterium]
MKKKFLVSLVAIILLAGPAFAAITVYIDCGDGDGMYTLVEGSTPEEYAKNLEGAKKAICGAIKMKKAPDALVKED